MRISRTRADWLPLLALVLVAAVIAGGFWLVPAFMEMVKHQDCVARGSFDC